MKNLRQPNLPRRIALQVDVRPKQQQQVRFAHDAFADLGVDERERDVGRRQLGALGHDDKGFGEVDKGGAAVFGGEKEDGEMAWWGEGVSGGLLGGRRVGTGGVGGGRGVDVAIEVGGHVRGADLEGGAAAAEVGMHFLRDVAVGAFEVAFEDACGVSGFAFLMRLLGCLLRVVGMRTGPLVDAEHGDSNTGTPGRDLGYIVDQAFQPRASSLLLFEFENHAEVFGEPAEAFHVLSDVLGRSVMVAKYRENAVVHCVVCLSYADVEGEYGMNDRVDEQVELCF